MVTTILAVLAGVETVALVEQAFVPERPTGVFPFQAITSTIFLVLAPFSPLLIILILYSWTLRVLLRVVSRYDVHHFLAERFRFLSHISQSLPFSWDGKDIPLLGRPLAVLAVGMVSASVLAFMPYRPDINPTGSPAGIDTSEYIQWVNQMLQRPVPDALGYAFGQVSNGSRPLSLVLPYVISAVFRVQGDVSVKFYPLFLAPLLVVSSFLFVFLGLGDKRVAGLVSLLTAFSFQLTVGMWAGYYANWLALAESYLLLGILVRFSNSKSRQSLVGLVLLSLALLFTHPWTWDLVILLAFVFIAEQSFRVHDFKLMKMVLLVVGINLATDSIRSFALGAYGGGSAGLDVATSSVGSSHFLALWPDAVALFVQNYDGIMADALILGLALMVIWRLAAVSQGFSRLLVLWVILASLPFPFLGSLLETRIVYLLPIPVLASAALLGIQRMRWGRTAKVLILLTILLYGANHALVSMMKV